MVVDTGSLIAAAVVVAAAIEFRSQRPGTAWRTTWDLAFAGRLLFLSFPARARRLQ